MVMDHTVDSGFAALSTKTFVWTTSHWLEDITSCYFSTYADLN